jgi:hypothetical protein
VNTPSTQESTIRYYTNRGSVGAWGGLVAGLGIIVGGASLAAHSFATTSCLLLGTVVVWYLGYLPLSKTCYFISPTKAGFKDPFRAREVQFEEIRSVTKHTSRNSITLIFVCNTRTVAMPLDQFDETWFSDLKTELLKRGITVSTTAFGFTIQKGG